MLLGRDDLTNTELKNVENLALKTSFDNVYRPNNKVRLDLGGTVSFYQIKGLYTDRQRAQINRHLEHRTIFILKKLSATLVGGT